MKGKHYAEYQAEQEGRPTWTTAIKQDIDECILQSRNMQEFLKELKNRGYVIKAGAKYFTLKPPGKERFVRIDRRLGEAYSLLGIENQIQENVKSGRYRMPEKKWPEKYIPADHDIQSPATRRCISVIVTCLVCILEAYDSETGQLFISRRSNEDA